MDKDQFLKQGAVISLDRDQLLVGWGERTWIKKPDKRAIQFFYFPDFFLAGGCSWFFHEHSEILSNQEFISMLGKSSYQSSFFWDPLQKETFFKIFNRIQEKIDKGELIKAVPYLFQQARGTVTSDKRHQMLSAASSYLMRAPAYLYGFWGDDEGLLGATPELLFSLERRFLKTMALAGTASLDRPQKAFLEDHKELHEHEVVVQSLLQALAPFGQVTRGSKEILKLPTLSHLKTAISVQLKAHPEFMEIVKTLHPTPALGAAPAEEGAKWLQSMEACLPRKRFGAPAGFFNGKKRCGKCYVAIRNVQWEGETIQIGAGCGVVKESQYEQEWGEIQLKLAAIQQFLKL